MLTLPKGILHLIQTEIHNFISLDSLESDVQ